MLAWYSLVVLIIAVVFGFIDRQIIVLVVEPMKRDLALDDLHIGTLQGLAPALVAVLAGFPLAWLADRMDRRWLLVACILFWSAATAARGLAGSFDEMLVLTTGIAVGEAALTPIVYSLIPDLFSGRTRQLANFIFFGAIIAGMGLGLMLGGAALTLIDQLRPSLPLELQSLASWRLACFLVAAPGLIVALMAIPIPATRVNRSAATSATTTPVPPLWPFLKENAKAISLIFGGIGVYGSALGIMTSWLPIAIMRDLGTPASSVGIRFGAILSTSALLGIGLAAVTAGFWRRNAPQAHIIRAMSVAMALATIPTALLAWATSLEQVYLLGGALLLLFFAGTAFSPTLLQELPPAPLRARFSAVSMIIYTIGIAGGPMAVGAISKYRGESQGLLVIVAVFGAVALALSAALLALSEKSFVAMQARNAPDQ